MINSKNMEKIKKYLYAIFALFFFISGRAGVFSPEVIRGVFIGGVAFLITIESFFLKNKKAGFLDYLLPAKI
ncbi:MAG: hypothetical protein H0S78_12690 [Tissierellales bacterium]|nr:hypothetical protein [Tissierellales bacterium]